LAQGGPGPADEMGAAIVEDSARSSHHRRHRLSPRGPHPENDVGTIDEPWLFLVYEVLPRPIRRLALRLMEAKFGPLSAKVKRHVDALSPGALARLQIDLLKAQSLWELNLQDGIPG
jgi:hypothetical protein